MGEGEREVREYPAPHRVETFGGRVEVCWKEETGVSLLGPLIYFVEFLKESGLWERWVEKCPLRYNSPNAPSKEEILGTILFSVLNGHRRYAHISGMRGEQTLAGVLGLERFRSEDSVRRAFEGVEEKALTLWMDLSMNESYQALLDQEWVLDVDSTVKTLYGKQEEARVGYNPTKPGRPSHVYHTMLFTAARLVLNVDVQAGNQTASLYSQDGLWGWLDAHARESWPTLVRGDCGHGNEGMMSGCEKRSLAYLFKLKQTAGVKKLVERLSRGKGQWEWRPAGQSWEGTEQELQLQGWSRNRRVVVLRRAIPKPVENEAGDGRQMSLPGMVIEQNKGEWWEYAVLVTNWEEKDVLGIAQMYRDRGDSENLFDELKNQWGWRGYSTQDLKRSQMMARIVGLIYNWWSIYTRMATGPRHGEAITTRPELQQGVARQTTHANQTRMTITSMHARALKIANQLAGISDWIKKQTGGAEQLIGLDRWRRMLRRIYQDFAGFTFDPVDAVPLLGPPNCRI